MIGRIIGFLVVALIAGFGGRALMPGNDNMSIKHTLMLGGAGSLIGAPRGHIGHLQIPISGSVRVRSGFSYET
jgi:uncharacterized membrane protein YeaQ/YmgE (transglycosylase-associated protein family)